LKTKRLALLFLLTTGSLFMAAVNTNAASFTNLYSFSALVSGTNSDGSNPYAGLVMSGNTLYGTTFTGGTNGLGTVFRVNTDGTGFTNLHNFTGSDGISPMGALALSANTLYGTASQGGSPNTYRHVGNGTVFKLNTDGTGFTNLHSFSGSDGMAPCAGLVLSGNSLYGTAWLQSTGYLYAVFHYGCGTVFKVNTDGTGFTNLHNFDSSGSNGAYPHAGLVLSGNTLYGTTQFGGSYAYGGVGYGTVFKVNTDGTGFTNVYSFSGASDGNNPVSAGLVLYGNTLYGTTLAGGTNGFGNVYRVNTDGKGFTNLYSFTDYAVTPFDTNSDGALPEAGLVMFGNTLYGTTTAGGSGTDGTMFRVNTDGTGYTNLHNFTAGKVGYNSYGGLVMSGNTLYGTAGTAQAVSSGNVGTVFALTLWDAIPPMVSISNPASAKTYTNAQTVTITAAASDNVGVTSVEFYDGGTLKGADTTAPYTYDWSFTSADNGTHTWTARACDAAQNVSTSSPVTLTVSIDITPPTVAISSPANGANLTTASATVSGTAGDPGSPASGVAAVEVRLNGGIWSDATGAASWTRSVTLSPCSNTIEARSRDKAGNYSTIASNFVTYTPPNTVPNTPTNVSPPNGAASVPVTPTLEASAFSDPDPLCLGDIHAASQWQVLSAGGRIVADSGTDTVNKVSWVVPVNKLYYGSNYQWHVRYRDSRNGWSSYSTQTRFTNGGPFLSASMRGTNVVLTWPTNSLAFALQWSTNLGTAIWSNTIPAPLIVSGQYTVTNNMTNRMRFYRLKK
jgi:uncharacterized repeat protein (TIGR03803 family)